MNQHFSSVVACTSGVMLVLSCGGTVEERGGGVGGSAGSGASGKGGSYVAGGAGTGAHTDGGGGGPAGASGAPGGHAGGPAGSGAYPDGGGGGPAGAGNWPDGGGGGPAGAGAYSGTGGTSCPPLPSCNWCNGKPLFDAQGCMVGYQCSNGIDPCKTPPCSNNQDCPAGENCGTDGLCSPGAPIHCGYETCGYSSQGDTNTDWEGCTDGNTYNSHCKPQSDGLHWNCACSVNSKFLADCTWNDQGAGGGPCDVGNVCCPFPF